MSTDLFTPPDIPTAIAKFGVQDVAIAKMKEEFMPLVIEGVNDKAGEERVHKARMVVVKARTSTEKKAKELNEEATKFTRAVHAEKNRILGLLEPIEDHLKAEERRVESEREAIRFAEQRKRDEEERLRKEAEEAERQKKIAEENARLASERAALKLEQEKLEQQRRKIEEAAAAERRKLEAERRKLEAEQAKIEAENAKIAKEARDRELAAQRAKDEAERVELQRLQRIEDERIAAELAEANRLLAERLKPDREKLLAVAKAVDDIVVGEYENTESMDAAIKIGQSLGRCAAQIREIVACMASAVIESNTEDVCPF